MPSLLDTETELRLYLPVTGMKFKYINGLEFEVGNYSKYWDNNESDQIYEKVKYLQFNSEAGVRTLEI